MASAASDEGDGLGVVRVKPLGVGGGGVERSAVKGGGGTGRDRSVPASFQKTCATLKGHSIQK